MSGPSPLALSDGDQSALAGDRGEAVRLAMRIITRVGQAMGATALLDITRAHIDGCLYHGRAGLDFARKLGDGGARVVVPTTLNVSSLDLLHPELVQLGEATAAEARALMDAYVSMGCRPTWTCAPYQLPERPSVGEHVAWAESNAIVFANSVLGARTGRYGDFIDICCAITGRAPAAGLHLDRERRARAIFRVRHVPERLWRDEAAFAAVGHIVGRATGSVVPAIIGLPQDTTEDQLKALGAAAASSGAVAMFHAVGITPEAPTLDAATAGVQPALDVPVDLAALRAARDELSTVEVGAAVGSESLGTPHCSVSELERLAELVRGRHLAIPVYVNTGRDVLARVPGPAASLREAGVSVVTDTCTYVTPIIERAATPVVTNSGKWAWYAPGNLGFDVAFATLEECIESAVSGRLERDDQAWGA
ncbi:MAG TPA: aconitase X catalytic domain-containing protein [Actinomycetota bacterium]|nr:aconitase X catalytic domain-containing protein [Actinomycetota bacterium]